MTGVHQGRKVIKAYLLDRFGADYTAEEVFQCLPELYMECKKYNCTLNCSFDKFVEGAHQGFLNADMNAKMEKNFDRFFRQKTRHDV